MSRFSDILSIARPIIETAYIDRFTVVRNQQVPHPDNPKTTRNQEMPVGNMEMLPCKWNPTEQLLRQDSPANIGLYDINDISSQYMVYTKPEYDIRKGDHIFLYKVDKGGNIITSYDGIASLSNVNANFQVFSISQQGEA